MVKLIIIGGSFAAMKAAKSALEVDPNAEVTIVAPSAVVFFNMAAPRALIQKDAVDKIFIPFKTALGPLYKRYTIVEDYAEEVDLDAKTVVTRGGDTLNYDYLVVASGSGSESPAFKLNGDAEASKGALVDYFAKIESAKSVAIVGGGVTGVEVAGEVASLGNKKVTLVTGSLGPLKQFPKLTASATSKLEKLKVEIINGLTVKDFDEKLITLSNDTALKFDLVIPTFGVKPNSSFMPASVLDDKGYIKVDNHFVVKGYDNVLAIGDVANISENTAIDIQRRQATVIKGTLAHFFKGSPFVEYNPNKMKDTILIPISSSGGVGLVSGWSAPNFAVRMLKSKTFFVDKASTLI